VGDLMRSVETIKAAREKWRAQKAARAKKIRFWNVRLKAAEARLKLLALELDEAKAAERKVHAPVDKILTDTWGYHPPGHDGVDVICEPDAVLRAMVKSKVIDVRTGGWWGKAPSGDVWKGDGIIQIEVLEDVGPFRKGQHIGYGHAEKPYVKVGQIVVAGQPLGHAGLAVAWHIHLMVNNGEVGLRGVGTRDPRPLLDYAVKNG
jgi:murein DD-endopeptidase MepM/ murein hydrolase activator NlpD